MKNRIHNFSAGPATLPEDILNEIKNGKFARDLETNVDTLKYKSSIDSKSSDEISKIMDVLFEKKGK